MKDNDDGNPVFEFTVHSLMMPHSHAKICPYASANQRKPQQGTLRHTPFAPFGLILVYSINQKGNGVYRGDIIENIAVR